MPGAPARPAGVGFQKVDIPNGDEPPLIAGIWYPTDAPVTPHALGGFTQTVAADAPIAGDRVVANAGHYDFLPPCDARLARTRPEICDSAPGLRPRGIPSTIQCQSGAIFRGHAAIGKRITRIRRVAVIGR
jgi:hypothetical protein